MARPAFDRQPVFARRDLGLRLARAARRLELMQLAPVTSQGRHLAIPDVGHVDDETGLEAIVQHVVEDSRRSVRLTPLGSAPFGETRVEAGGFDETVRAAVIGMTVRRRRREHQLRAQPAQDLDQRVFFGGAGSQGRVAAVEKLDRRRSQCRGRTLGLASALVDRAAGAGFAARQVEQADLGAGLGHPGQSAAAGELGVVSTDRFGYTGVVRRYDTLSDAQNAVNQVGADIAIDNRDLSLYIVNGVPSFDVDTNVMMGSWWYSTEGSAGYGNTRGNSA